VDFSSKKRLLATSIDVAELINRIEKVAPVSVVVTDISSNEVFGERVVQ